MTSSYNTAIAVSFAPMIAGAYIWGLPVVMACRFWSGVLK